MFAHRSRQQYRLRISHWLAALLSVAACDGSPAPPPADGVLPPLPPQVVAKLPAPGPERPTHDLALALVGEVRGEIDPCGCPTLPMGGFERRKGLLDELRAEGRPVFHLDAGNMLVEGYATGGRGDTRDRARLMIELSAMVGLDVLCPGPADLLALEPKRLQATLSQRDVALVSSTWLEKGGGPLFEPSVVIERDGVRLGVVGLSARPGDPAWRERIHYRDAVASARSAIETLPDDLDLVVALSNLDDDEANRVARQVPGLAAVLSVANDAMDSPRNKGRGLVIEVPSRGRYVTLVRVRSATNPGAALDLDSTEFLDLETRDNIADKKRRLERRGELLPERDIQVLADHESRLTKEAAGRNLAYVVDYPMGTRYRGDPGTTAAIDSFKDRVIARAIEDLEEEQRRPDGPPRYVSSSPCFPCHAEQYGRWALTSHTRALEVLIPRGEHENPECLSCHTTGFAVEGGWATIDAENIRKFKAVQCEACHGPLEGHPEDEEVQPTIPTRTTCERCHDPPNSPAFDYTTYLQMASCTAAPYEPPNEPLEADPLLVPPMELPAQEPNP